MGSRWGEGMETFQPTLYTTFLSPRYSNLRKRRPYLEIRGTTVSESGSDKRQLLVGQSVNNQYLPPYN